MTAPQGDGAKPAASSTSADAVAASQNVRRDARELEGAVEDISRPFNSHTIISNLARAENSLAESVQKLAGWHSQASVGTHFQESGGKGIAGAVGAAVKLDEAAQLAYELRGKLEEALDENGKVRWLDGPSAAPDSRHEDGTTAQ